MRTGGAKMARWAAALALAACLLGAQRHKDAPTCPDHCRQDAKDCGDVCRKYANAKALKFCTQACEKSGKDCEDSCANKKPKR